MPQLLQFDEIKAVAYFEPGKDAAKFRKRLAETATCPHCHRETGIELTIHKIFGFMAIFTCSPDCPANPNEINTDAAQESPEELKKRLSERYEKETGEINLTDLPC